MAELKRQFTQEEIDRMLYMQGLRPRSTSDIVQSNLASQTIKSIPQNVFQKIAGGAGIAKEAVNKLGNASDLARLFPGYQGQSNVNIPTSYNFAMKQDPMGGVIPSGLQTQQVNVDQLLKAIKPADVLGITGAQQAYSDVGMGRAPNPMDVLDIVGLGAAGLGAGKGLLKTGVEAGKFVAPKVGQMAEEYAVGTGLLSPITAWHASPYRFDKFDINKVNTGEGAQAYGHGMYYAEKRGTAEDYLEKFQGRDQSKFLALDGDEISYLNLFKKVRPYMDKEEYADLLSDARNIKYRYGDKSFAEWLNNSALDRINEAFGDVKFASETPASLYKIDIPDKAVETFIDWDKPLTEQTKKVQELIELVAEQENLPINYKKFKSEGKDKTGQNFYDSLTKMLGNDPKSASNILNSYGIGGIKYLDRVSRKEGKGTNNFVVFDPNIVEMLERNNKPMK